MFDNCFQGRRVLITGHTGFKGAWLALWLKHLGAEVSGFSLYIPSSPSAFEALNLSGKMTSYEGDIRNLEDLIKVHDAVKPDMLFHLAARSIVSDCYHDPKLAFDTNLAGTVNIFEICRASKSLKTAVIITSDKCYDNVEWVYGYRETDPLGGKDPYSASKACAEIAFKAYFQSYFKHKSAFGIATVRAGNVIGGGDWAKDRVVPDSVRAWKTGQDVFIRSPKATRPWQHVLEPLSGYLWLASQLDKRAESLSGEAFNFGPQAAVNFPVITLLEEMKRYWPTASWKLDAASLLREKEAHLLQLCGDKAFSHLGWRAILSFAETVEMTARWYKQYYDGQGSIYDYSCEQIAHYQDLAKERKAPWSLA